MTKCAACNNPVIKNHGVMKADQLIDLCSVECRATFRRSNAAGKQNNPLDPATPKKAMRSRVKRKPSPSAIKRAARPREGDISRSIGQMLTDSGIWNTRTQSGVLRLQSGHTVNLCKAGTPDRVAAFHLNFWFEIKRPGEIPSAEQAKVIAELRDNGSIVFVLDSVTDFDFLLRSIKGKVFEMNAIGAAIRNLQAELDAELLEFQKQNGR
jgi:hypothetical protein